MKRIAALLLLAALLILPTAALAGAEDALGFYMPLTEAQIAEEQREAAEIITLLFTDDMTDGEKALVLHDWIVLSCRYEMNYYQDMDYGAVVLHTAICRGYARGYAYLANAAGLSTEYSFSADLEHAWTLSLLDGSYYIVDPTWDDDHYERIGFVNHRHCMISDQTAREQRHDGGDCAIVALGGSYENAPWHEAVTRVVFEDDYLYYVNRNLELIRCNRQTWGCETLYRIEQRWPGFYEDYADIPAPATGLILMRGRLWFNTPFAILSVNTDGSDLRQELAVDGTDGYICGIDAQDGRLVYSLSDEKENVGYTLCDSGISAFGAWGVEATPEGPWQSLLGTASELITE